MNTAEVPTVYRRYRAQKKYRDVLSRAGQTINIEIENKWLLDIALDHLSLGRAHLLQALQEELTISLRHTST